MAYVPRLVERENRLGRPVRIGLVGAGQMGVGFVAQVRRIPGLDVVAIADVAPGRAEAAYREAGGRGDASGDLGVHDDILSSDDVDKLSEAVLAGRPSVVPDAGLLTGLPVDVLVDASGVPEVGAAIAFQGLLAGKDIAMLNVECDVTVGRVLTTLAQRMGRVYTVCRGDEPVECKRLVDYARDIGFEVVCAGKGKNNPLNPQATPASLQEQARARGMNPKMLASFVDGSKTMIEMAALANTSDLAVSRRGMHGPEATVDRLAEIFTPTSAGGVLDHAGVVDYCTGGGVAPGVFAVGYCDDPTVRAEMEYLSMGSGPYYSFYRPYHLASVEAALSVAEAVCDRQPSLAPTTWNAEVIAVAKRPLRRGDRIDGIGGSTVYGVVDDAGRASEADCVPLGLLEGAEVLADIPADTPLTGDAVAIRETSTIASLRRLQDQLLAGHALDGVGLPGEVTERTGVTGPA